MGAPIEDLNIYHLAIKFGRNPAEIRQWDLYDLSRINLVMQAQDEAIEVLRKRNEPKT